MALSNQDMLKKMEEMMTKMTAPIIETLHHLKKAQEKKKNPIEELQDDDSDDVWKSVRWVL